ncbi:hypothetical protein SAMN06295964_2189 [Aeromicrobium choanae]|uniref:Uncharacterized protein n=1 Tax=Aeromicrobium choanae TaxID=1736691 RepID=A0A1T4Z391_9ACTN|nr:hypothetical protein SAMN06295964_2189 [Aeromicrobium choanae]
MSVRSSILVGEGFTCVGSAGDMNRLTWLQIRRTALVLSCAAYFTTLAVIGQVADGDPAPELPTRLVEAAR